MDDKNPFHLTVLILERETYHIVNSKCVGFVYPVLEKGLDWEMKVMSLVNKKTGHFVADLH